MLQRRRFLAALATLIVVPRASLDAFVVRGSRGPHPVPRLKIDASRVIPRDQLKGEPQIARVFDMVRQMPQVVDGIRCPCGCDDVPEHYSLLSCFETDGMARDCTICRDAAQLVFELHERGQKLDAIRGAIDAKYGQ
jgi:hypothetical protein